MYIDEKSKQSVLRQTWPIETTTSTSISAKAITITRIRDPLLNYILNHQRRSNYYVNNDGGGAANVAISSNDLYPDENFENDIFNVDDGSLVTSFSLPSSPSSSSSSSESSAFFLINQYQQNQSDLSLIPLISSSPSFTDITINETNSHNHYPAMMARSLPILVLLSSLLICLILATIIGNVFVISAVIWERSLRTVGNYLVVSLAITDLLVACLVMPIGAIYEVMGEWHMGVKLCELWTFIDVLCCTTSIFHLLAIACDRLWAVTNVDYIHRRKTKHVCFGIAIIWLFSAIISLGPMLGWKDSEFEKRIIERKECMISQDISYQIFATIASFYAPSILLLFQYYRIYQVAKTRLKLKKQRYQYRIRRRPSFYRTRKESEVKEFPRVSHRVSLNTNEEFFSSSVMPPPSSTSGVYSSSTATDFTTTATTNTTLSTDRTSSIVSLSPPILLKPPISVATIAETPSTAATSPITGKRFSIVQFFNNQHRKSENLDGQKFSMANFDDFDNNDLRSNESSIDESTIIVAGPTSNIVVYVDDYGSTICSSSGGDNGISYYQETDFVQDDDEFVDSPVDDIVVDVTDPDDHDSAIDEEVSIRQEGESPDDLDMIPEIEVDQEEVCAANTVSNVGNGNFLAPPPAPIDMAEQPEMIMIKPSFNGHTTTQLQHRRNSHVNHSSRRGSTSHHYHHKKHKRRRIRKLKFRNKISRVNNGQNSNVNRQQETKAAKTLTIITGVFIICWLPFFVLALVIPLCGDNCYINKYIFDFVVWLGWSNSTLNPFLYTIFSPDFRNAFKKLLKRIKKKS